MEHLLTAAELARHLKLSPDTIKAWAREGIIPAIRITPKVIRYDLEKVNAALHLRSNERGGDQ